MHTKHYRTWALLAVPLLGGCFLFDQGSETSLGLVHVEALLVENSCGPGIGAQGPSMEYDVELSLNGSTLTWSGPGSSAQGILDDEGRFCIEMTRSFHVRDPDPWYEDPGCDMVELERLCGAITLVEEESDAGVSEERVTAVDARHEIAESAQPGSLCPEMIGIAQGQVLALPCQVAYQLTGTAADR